MQPTMTAKDCMNRKINAVRPDDDIRSVVKVLVNNNVSGVPVIDNIGNLLGMITEKDCMALAISAGYFGECGGRVSDIMSTNVVTVDTDTPLMEIAEQFTNATFRRLPVLESGRVVGVVSRRDVLWLFERHCRPESDRA